MTRTLPMGAAMLLALVFTTPPASAQRRDRGLGDGDTQPRLDTTVAFTKSGAINLNLPAGDIVVRSWDRDQVKVHATSEGGEIRFNASSSRITLLMDRAGWRGGDGRFELTVPAGVRVVAHSQSGDIDIRGTRGDVEASSQSGDLHIEDIGRLDASSLSGDVQVRSAAGDAAVHTVSGDFRIDGVKGDVDVESVSGGIEIHDAAAKFVRAHSVSGDVSYDGTIEPTGRYELSAHSGEIAITLPASASAQINVSTWSGSIDSDFPITLKPGEHGGNRFSFEVGGGAARVSLESFSGDITIDSTGSRRRGR